MLLVTGITGHTGRYFLQELISNNYKGHIRCVVRKTSDTSLLDKSGLNIEKVIGDLENPNFIDRIMDDVETVMHIYNIHHSLDIVRTAINKKLKRVILVHTTGIYSEFKHASEGYKKIEKEITELKSVSNYIPKITILRPSMIYGDLCDRNMSKFIQMVDKLKIFPVINGGDSLIQPVHARDIAKAYYTVLMFPEKVCREAYDLSGEKPIRMIDAFKLISKELNKKTVFITVPLSLGVWIARLFKTLTLGKIDYVERIQRMGENRSYSHENASIDFGYTPMSFKKGIQIEVQAYLSNNRN